MTDNPLTALAWDATALDGTQACIYACTTRGTHQPACPCHQTCPDHDNHCTGCAPRPAHDGSWLCGSCFHRKLRSPLRRVPALFDWLTAQKAGIKAQAYNDDRVTATKEAPLPFHPGIVDHLSLMSLLLNAWAHRAATTAPPAPGPKVWDAAGSAAWLDAHADWVAEQRWVPELIAHMAELERRARALAPWQAPRHHLPLPCRRCDQQTLVLFGGDDWVTCTNPECDEIIGWFQYQSLSRAIGRIYENEQKAGTA